jgi:hypothetical protein
MRVSAFPDKEIAMLRVVRLTIFCLILITATIHIFLAYPAGLLGFYLAAAGFFLLAIVYVNPTRRFNRDHVVLVLRVWTIATLVLWFILGDRSLIAFLDKVVELLIIGLLWVEQRLA